MDFNEFLESVSKIKNIPLPSEASHYKMIPAFRKDLLNQQGEGGEKVKKAAVLALFYPNASNETNFVLILRKTYNGVHSAQIAFPGGKFEIEDADLEYTALRETYEEIGVPIEEVVVLKKLTPVYIPPSNFNVQPFLGVLEETPSFIKQEKEVEELIEVPIKCFLNESSLVTHRVSTSYSAMVEVPAFKLNSYIVWGATAMMLSEVKDILNKLL